MTSFAAADPRNLETLEALAEEYRMPSTDPEAYRKSRPLHRVSWEDQDTIKRYVKSRMPLVITGTVR